MLLGYIIGIFTIPKFISQSTALRWCAILGVIFTVLAVVTSGGTSVFFIAALGLANSLMWPAIFPLGIDGIGKFTKTGSALLVMGICGGGVIPLVYGWVGQHSSLQQAYIIMVPVYLYILYFSVKGYRVGKA
jgi:fucose permease